MDGSTLGKVPQSPTLPGSGGAKRKFDVADLYGEGTAETGSADLGLDEKFRKAYFWITNCAIITPFYDIEYEDGCSISFKLGDSGADLRLPSDISFSSFVLLPLLTLLARRKCLFVGGPGRGKTASSILMGVIAGYPLKELKRAIQHGQPQMTISDLLGSPVPQDLLKSETMRDIRISWKSWLSMRVKIVDEYNRIPTRTQSALLTVMADNYAEMMDQVYECPESAWFLTANDDAGGGTYEVIEALRDRIDVVVHSLHFNTRFIGELLSRVESGIKPEAAVPPEIVFTEAELDRAYAAMLEVVIPPPLLRRLEYFAAQFEFFEAGGRQFEYRTKDNVKLAGLELSRLEGADGGKDRTRDLGLQTKNGVSVRAIMTSIVYIKAIAWFRGKAEAGLDDMRNVLPFVFHDKLVQNQDAPWFEQGSNAVYRVDRISWLRELFDLSCAEYDRLGRDGGDPVAELLSTFATGLEGVSAEACNAELVKIERELATMSEGRKLHGPMYDEALTLKYLHQRYTSYHKWLSWRS